MKQLNIDSSIIHKNEIAKTVNCIHVEFSNERSDERLANDLESNQFSTYNDVVERVGKELGLRTYQKECANKAVKCFLSGYSIDFLISACCRYGKTTTALAVCRILLAILGINDAAICVVTGLPGSVKSSWRDDAYRLGFINTKDLSQLDVDNVDFNKTDGISLTFISTQKLGDNTNEEGQVITHSFIDEYKEFYNNHKGLKIMITDEAHNAFGTDRILDALKDFNFDYKLELTATPYTQELITKYRLDSTIGDRCTYFFSQIDMLKLYEHAKEITLANGMKAKEGFTYLDKETGEEKPWQPVQPVVIIEDLYEKLRKEGFDFLSFDEEPSSTAFVSTYFKLIFSDTKKYDKFCKIFVETYIIEMYEKYGITNILAFDTTNEFANKVAAYINKYFGDRIYAKSLADEKLGTDETSVDKANEVFERNDGRIHIVITCRKCGTGSSMPKLDATMFLKGVVSYIEYCQFAARSYNPCDGKVYGYTIMFSPAEALRMIAQHANGEKGNPSDHPEAGNIEDYLEHIKVYLDGTQMTDATELITKLDSVYRPGQSELFISLDIMNELDELADSVIRDATFSERTPKDDGPQEPKDGQSNTSDSDEDETKKPRKPRKPQGTTNEGNSYNRESVLKAFQEHFVDTISIFAEEGYSEEEISAIDEYSSRIDIRLITKTLCTMKLWNKLRTEYFDKILHKVYVYVSRKLNEK